jgi:Mn2+/Fe2+ NRAMP family transporter
MFMVKVPWSEAAKSLVIPSLRWEKDYLTTVVAVLGTTISPYLFFWQASQEAEDVRTVPARQILKRAPHQGEAALNRIHLDTFVGMGFSNFIALAIMMTAAATLHANKVTDIQTSAKAAEALRPIAGALEYLPLASSALACCPSPSSPDRRHTPSAKRGSGRRGSPASRWKPRPSTRSFASRRSSA